MSILKNKAVIITVIGAAAVLLISYFISAKDSSNVNPTDNIISENTNDTETNYYIENNSDDDFKTSIQLSNDEKELIQNNNLVNDSKFSIDERLEAKKVAENFIQAIESFDINKPKETVEEALKYVVDEKKEEIESLYIYLGKNQDIKKKIIDEVKSYEVENEYNNDYILFDVYVNWSVVDKYDQISNSGGSSYEVKLLKFNGEYKVVEYRVI
ncbi:hypothetical protein H9660_14180 [Clostridium sp. Sa3CUN1]|uniref:Uncharacterized protein n=1 Tax=Clostridium gallinarum TaxID=2762246 RepID=A0ABR8Q783_9CLOT|nr:hypothetical protein [Clostridium gallinarum]MBD7916291.1 hypothetical protein [Clostridium gallinarum]